MFIEMYLKDTAKEKRHEEKKSTKRKRHKEKGGSRMNVITLIGRLVRNPNFEIVEKENGIFHISTFVMAVPGNYNKDVNYIKIKSFGSSADFVRDYFKQGKRVAVTGELQTGSYVDQETGKRVNTSEVVTSKVEFADGKGSDEKNESREYEDDFRGIDEEFAGESPFR